VVTTNAKPNTRCLPDNNLSTILIEVSNGRYVNLTSTAWLVKLDSPMEIVSYTVSRSNACFEDMVGAFIKLKVVVELYQHQTPMLWVLLPSRKRYVAALYYNCSHSAFDKSSPTTVRTQQLVYLPSDRRYLRPK
jgi:hypothetical protein